MIISNTPNRTISAEDPESVGGAWVIYTSVEGRETPVFSMLPSSAEEIARRLLELQHSFFRGRLGSDDLLLFKAPGRLDQTIELLALRTMHAPWPSGTDIQLGIPSDWARDSTVALEYEHETLRSIEIEKELQRLFWDARDEVFEDGAESEFTKQLERFILERGNDVIDVLRALSSAELANPSILAEALVCLGRLDDPHTLESRLALLATSLFHSSPEVRDSAGLGLAALGDSRGAAYLRSAAEREPISELRRELVRVADYLA